VAGVNLPDGLLYTSDHEWVRIDGDTATIGITDYAQDALGDIVFIALPALGRTVAAGESFAEIESTKSVNDVYSPFPGEVTGINDDLGSAPETVNSDPYGKGWICTVRLADPSVRDGLMSAEEYRAFVGA
jgi:glycine cleavage system H protein